MSQETAEINFQSSTKDRKDTSITMEVTVAADVLNAEIDRELLRFQKEARLAGFRQGKAPLALVKEKFFDEAKNRAGETLLRQTIIKALEKENFNPIDYPTVEEFECEPGKDLRYKFVAECRPTFNVKDYKAIPISKEIFKVGDANISETLDSLRLANAKIVPSKNEIATDKSLVSVDYTAFDEQGKPIDEIVAKNQLLDLGDAKTLVEFRNALNGAKPNDEKEIKISYPQDYPNKIIAGKTVTFKVKVIDIKEKQEPQLNDDFAKDLGLQSLDELKNKIKETLEQEEIRRQNVSTENQIIKYLLEKNVFELPSCLVKNQLQKLIDRMKDYLKKHGASEEEINREVEISTERLNQEAVSNVRLAYILNAISDAENIAVSDADLQAEKEKMLAENPNRSDMVEKYFAEHKDEIALSLKETKLFDFLVANAKITESQKDMPLKKA
ncbi:MAG: trigger factor [Elusimicrobiota bacterium]|jgi:trigger factor|nr:trigger factor [Elusimicrobiota bacterium]